MLLRKVGGAIFSLAVSRFTSARDSEISQLGEQLLYLSRKIVNKQQVHSNYYYLNF